MEATFFSTNVVRMQVQKMHRLKHILWINPLGVLTLHLLVFCLTVNLCFIGIDVSVMRENWD